MRSGIHAVTGWIIQNLDHDSVLYYNNIKMPYHLPDDPIKEDRLIKKSDTRIQEIVEYLTENPESATTVIKSHESKTFDFANFNASKNLNVIIIRNPYNTLASSLEYIKNNGVCKDIVSDSRFDNLWTQHAEEFSGITSLLDNKVAILYDRFIVDPEYRLEIAEQLDIEVTNNIPPHLKMGGGSSFKSSNHQGYLNREELYKDHIDMIRLKSNSTVNNLWFNYICSS